MRTRAPPNVLAAAAEGDGETRRRRRLAPPAVRGASGKTEQWREGRRKAAKGGSVCGGGVSVSACGSQSQIFLAGCRSQAGLESEREEEEDAVAGAMELTFVHFVRALLYLQLILTYKDTQLWLGPTPTCGSSLLGISVAGRCC